MLYKEAAYKYKAYKESMTRATVIFKVIYGLNDNTIVRRLVEKHSSARELFIILKFIEKRTKHLDPQEPFEFFRLQPGMKEVLRQNVAWYMWWRHGIPTRRFNQDEEPRESIIFENGKVFSNNLR